MDIYNAWITSAIISYNKKFGTAESRTRDFISEESAQSQLRASIRFWENQKPKLMAGTTIEESDILRIQECLRQQRDIRNKFKEAGITLD